MDFKTCCTRQHLRMLFQRHRQSGFDRQLPVDAVGRSSTAAESRSDTRNVMR